MNSTDQTLLATVRRWIELDPDSRTRAELEALLADPAGHTALAELFAGRLSFGTAGLRAPLGPGPLRMNRLVVRQTATGILQYAESKLGENTGARVVVIGFDARHYSPEFAHDTAAIFAQAGWTVHLFDTPGPTPLLAREVLRLDAAVGVMVTASHNPPQDNGYKVYLGGEISRLLEPHGLGVGAQIVSPVDTEIAATIAQIVEQDFDQAASEATAPADQAEEGLTPPDGVEVIGAAARQAYQQEALGLLDAEAFPHRDLTVVYTAMHGVGGDPVVDLLSAAGFTNVIPVAEQFAPDPDFPTAEFPNPEEPGALDLALKTAEREQADLVLANDPDADRLSAAVFDPQAEDWRQLSGDEMGVLLGRHVLQRGPLRAGWRTDNQDDAPRLANSLVSSRQLGALCQARGVAHESTLTGFKWLARVPNIIFGYEEAIGFDVDTPHVRDKDGVSAALIFCEMVASLKADGSTVVEALDEIAAEAGVFLTSQVTITVEKLSELGDLTAGLRANPPQQIAGSTVRESLDLSTDPLPGAQLDEAKLTDVLIYYTEAGDRVIVRPSGTEPKVKCYLESVAEPEASTAEALQQARSAAKDRLAQLREAMAETLGAGA